MRAQRIRYLVRSRREKEAREEINRFCITLGSVMDAQAVTDSRKYLEGYLEYVAGRERAFLAIARTVPSLKLLAALTAGQVDEARRMTDGLEEPAALDHLLLYIAASRVKRADIAGPSLDKAVALFAKGDAPSRRVAGILSSGSVDAAELTTLKLLPGEKRIVLVAIGLRIPAVRAQAFETAKTMNYSAMPPRLLLDKIFLGK